MRAIWSRFAMGRDLARGHDGSQWRVVRLVLPGTKRENPLGDLREALAPGRRGDVARGDAEGGDARGEVGHAEAGGECEEARSVIGTIAYICVTSAGRGGVFAVTIAQEGDRSRGFVERIECEVKVNARRECAHALLASRCLDARHNLERDALRFADVESDVAGASV